MKLRLGSVELEPMNYKTIIAYLRRYISILRSSSCKRLTESMGLSIDERRYYKICKCNKHSKLRIFCAGHSWQSARAASQTEACEKDSCIVSVVECLCLCVCVLFVRCAPTRSIYIYLYSIDTIHIGYWPGGRTSYRPYIHTTCKRHTHNVCRCTTDAVGRLEIRRSMTLQFYY